MKRLRSGHLVAGCVVAAALGLTVSAGAQGRQGGGATSPRAAAPVDLTGTWVSLVTEDWRWRMVTPPKGDYSSVPLNPAGVALVNAWDPAKDTAAGEQCKAYGAGAIMRVPGRVRISWQDDSTMKLEAEAGTQTRLFHFTPPPQAGPPSWQGLTIADWQLAGGGRRRGAEAAPSGGSLKVVTTNMKAGYLRKNGVPYSASAVVTEYFTRVTDPFDNQDYLIVTTVIDDPQYLARRFFTSSHFKKVDGATWTPTACSAS